jgi:hypothetical protein
MKSLKTLTFLCAVILFASCESNDPIVLDPVASETISNLFAPQIGGPGGGGNTPPSGSFTLFDFETGAETTDANAWDIGFRGTSIIVNGGASLGTADEPNRTGNAAVYLDEDGFSTVTEVDESLFAQDSASGYAIPTGGGNGWYDYRPFPENLIIPRAGVSLVIRTTEGRFAKVQIESYYENAPVNPDSSVDAARYYTFNYVYQPNEGVISFE